VCHSILLNRLGITGTVLNWFKSYFTDRSQFVVLGNNKSDIGQVRSGVPQGSVLGPILFSVYMLPFGQIIRKYMVWVIIFMLVILKFSSKSDPTVTSKILSECVQEIKTWMYNFFLNCILLRQRFYSGTPAATHKGRHFTVI